MADVDSGGGGGRGRKGGGSKTKKKSTRIDMTAMVDVAFLLLTFFVLTAVIQDSSVMTLLMPPKVDPNEIPEDETRVKVDEEKIVTLILNDNDKVTWYQGITNPELADVSFDPKKGVRQVLIDHLKRYPRLCRDEKRKFGQDTPGCWDPIFIIKPRYNSKYRNLVDVLDEMAIIEAPKYAIDKFTEQDSLLLIGELEVTEEE